MVKQTKFQIITMELESTPSYTNLEHTAAMDVNGMIETTSAMEKYPQKSTSQKQSRQVFTRGSEEWGEEHKERLVKGYKFSVVKSEDLG